MTSHQLNVNEPKRLLLFFSSRRRHTRSLCDWSSDVCSSDLAGRSARIALRSRGARRDARAGGRSEERRVGKSVDLGGRRIIKKKKKEQGRRGAAASGGGVSWRGHRHVVGRR